VFRAGREIMEGAEKNLHRRRSARPAVETRESPRPESIPNAVPPPSANPLPRPGAAAAREYDLAPRRGRRDRRCRQFEDAVFGIQIAV